MNYFIRTAAIITTVIIQVSKSDDMYYIKYSLQNINGNQSQAESICLRNDNSFLPFSDTLNDYTRIQEYIKEYNVQKSWIGLKKRMYNTPHWINSSVVAKHLLPKGKAAPPEKQCGYLSVYKNIDVAECSQVDNEYGTLCMKECNECEVSESFCFKFGRNCIMIYCGQYNWFAARRLCQKHGSDLLILPNTKDSINTVADSIEKIDNPCTNFWIGMSTFSWNTRKGVINSWNWAEGEPSTSGGCAYLHQGSGWHSANCSETHDIICSKRVKKQLQSTTLASPGARRISTKQQENIPTCKESSSHVVVFSIDRITLILFVVVWTVITFVLSAISIHYWYHRKRDNRSHAKERQNVNSPQCKIKA